MANSFVRYTGNNSTTAYSIPFSYRSTGDLTVTLSGSATTAFTLNAAGTTLTFNTAPALNVAIEIRRTTSQTTRLTDYASGSVLTENDLDTDSEQAFFMSQEAIDDADDVIKISSTDFQYDAGNKQIRNVANPTSNQDVATKHYLENTFLTTANKTALTTINANISNIIAVNNNSTNINSAVSNATNINTVANNIGSVNTVATDISKVIAVANDLAEAVSEVETVADDLNETTSEINTVGVNIANVNNVGNNIANVNAVAGNATNINAVNSNSSNINTVAGNNTNINTVAGANTNITTLAGINANITTVAGINSNVSTVAGISSDVTAVAGISSDVQAVENIKANVTTVAGISGNVTSVAGIASAVSAVNSNSSNINAVNSNASNINTVASNNSNISTVAGVSSDVTTVAGIASDVSAVENIASNVTTVAGMSTAINTVNSNSTNVNAVGGAITNVNNVGGSIANVNTVATNLASVNAFGETYRIASSAPSTSLNSGDLYFNTSTNVLNVYGASGWQNAGSSVNGTSERFKFVASGTPTSLSGNDANGNTLAYDAGFIDVYLNGIKMVNGTDVTVTSGSAIVFASALTNGDIVEAIAFGTFSVANLNASNLSSGTVPDARITGTYTGITGLDLTDNSKIRLGNGNDLEIFHDGSNSNISDVGTGGVKIFTAGVTDSGFYKVGGEKMATFEPDASVTLFHDNVKKFETTSTGATVTGTATVTGGLTVDTNTLFVNSSNNRVGIGTSSPANTLDVNSSSGGVIKITRDSQSSYLQLSTSGSDAQVFSGAGALKFKTGSSEAGRFDTSGNLLVGTTSTTPATGTSSGNLISSIGRNQFSSDSDTLELNRHGSNGIILSLRKDGTRVGVIGSQKWGIGTSSPVTTLDVGGSLSGNQGVVGKQMLVSQTLNTAYNDASSGSWGGLMLNNNNSSTSVRTATGLHFTHGTSGVAGIVSTSTTSQRADIRFITRGAGDAVADRVIIHDDGVMSASQGIALGVGTANTASNVLDDYEEGTWTPRVTLNGNTAPSNIAYAGSTQGVYTRVGRVVTINFHIELSNKGTGTNTPLWLSGASLPFTSSGIYSASMYTPIFINKSGQTKRGYLYGTWDSANGIKIALTDGNTNIAFLDHATVANNFGLAGTATYYV